MATTSGADHNGFVPASQEKDFQPTTSNGYAHGSGHDQQHELANGHGHFGHQLHPSYSNNVPALAFGGALQPGVWRPYEHRKFANPAPLGLCAFALTTFVLSAVNLHARGVTAPNIVVPLAFAYGGLVQLLAGMWEMAVGNTFGATALSSYGGFWIAYALLQTPQPWQLLSATDGPYAADPADIQSAIGFFLTGWFIFTTILLLCTLKSTVAFFSLFFTLDLAFLFLSCESYAASMGHTSAARGLQIAGGTFGMLAAFLAWYNALAGLQDNSNSFFRVPVIHMPWSDMGQELRKKKSRRHDEANARSFRSIASKKMAIPSTGERPVIIVGSGLAGLAAAHEALKAGASVRMLDRAPKPGGNSIKASSGINGANTRFQRERGVDSDESFYPDTIKSAGKRFTEWQHDLSTSIDRDKLIARLTSESAAAVEWLNDEVGVDLSVVATLGGHSLPRTHRGAGKLPPGAAIVTTLLKTLGENPSFQLTTSAEVKSLDVSDGQVRGVHFVRKDGESTTEAHLQGPVVFAVGGFAGDAHGLLAKYRPDLAGIPSTNEARPASHGLLEAVNAELVDMDSVQIHPTGFVDPKDPTSQYKFLAAEVLRGEGGILLAPSGKRFIDELQTREVVSRAIMGLARKEEPGSDVRQWEIKLLLDPGACEAAGSHLGFYLFKGLVEKKKVRELDPAVIESVDAYAQAVADGKDDLGRKTFGHWRLKPGEENREEEVCIGTATPIIHFTMGGVAFNERTQVLRRDEEGNLVPVPGLWAAGEITGGIHGDNRLGGSSLLECAVFGREAGRQAAAAV
ncbi:GPR1/FUN34/yaaH family-domain-containing protein [Plectosphaerella plurivora]|uniref:GPR1/FUN34/yaaH family-domain-containing protein n=1 Tax=Plectosphaerella plurivora TaxID=936078 RepID=A0A9P8VL81_9PEZI|nr:GPR1/FUN34/yaaH family-domain-containing protein [Plectosphaerella plurivora]